MTMLTFSYKQHYIHVYSMSNTEKVEVQILNYTKEGNSFELYAVKSIRAAKLLITKHIKSTK